MENTQKEEIGGVAATGRGEGVEEEEDQKTRLQR